MCAGTRDKDLKTADQVPYRLLTEEPDHSYGEASENLLVQGDNLEALKALLPFYAGRVKCIYIDPPYNTGSAFEHYDDALEHSKWLAMMYPRLEILREFLSPEGTIWVSIDDDESHYLKVLMDEVFGRKNFIANVLWQKRTSPDGRINLGDAHDHILVYGSKEARVNLNRIDLTTTAIKEKLKRIETERKSEAFQLALFDNDAIMEPENDRFVFGDGIFGDSPRHPLHGRTFSKHLLGEANIPLMDGKEDGEEFQCAIALNGLDDVNVWVRNVANHADAFRLTMHNGSKYYPDFIAKLNNGRIFVVEYKGSQGTDREDTRKKALVANLWAQKTGNVYAVIEKMKHGHGMAAQMLEAIRSKPH